MFGFESTSTTTSRTYLHRSLLDRILHREPSTVTESHTVTSSRAREHHFPHLNLSSILSGAGIGAGVGGLLGGFSLLTKTKLPLLGKVTSIAGLGRLAGLGAGVGIAAALYPALEPALRCHPGLKAAVDGALIGAGAGMILPLVSPVIGAAVGAAIAYGVHVWRKGDVVVDPYPVPVGGAPSYPGSYVPAGYYPANSGIVPPWMTGGMAYAQPAYGYGMLSPYNQMYATPGVLGMAPHAQAPAPASGAAAPAPAVVKPKAVKPKAAKPKKVAHHHKKHAAHVKPKPKPKPKAVSAPAATAVPMLPAAIAQNPMLMQALAANPQLAQAVATNPLLAQQLLARAGTPTMGMPTALAQPYGAMPGMTLPLSQASPYTLPQSPYGMQSGMADPTMLGGLDDPLGDID